MKKKLLAMASILCLTLTACGNTATSTKTEEPATEPATEAPAEESSDSELLTGKYTVCIEIENYDPITLELDADAAPITVTNFMKLVNEGFYDGLTFHRIIAGFMMQGGDPTGTGMGGSDEEIKGEFAANGIENPISHKRGVISMARSMAADSASSQFFICHEDSEFLDGQYAAFGQVISGIETVDAVCADAIVEDDNGTVAPGNQPKIIRIYEVK